MHGSFRCELLRQVIKLPSQTLTFDLEIKPHGIPHHSVYVCVCVCVVLLLVLECLIVCACHDWTLAVIFNKGYLYRRAPKGRILTEKTNCTNSSLIAHLKQIEYHQARIRTPS